MPITEDAVLAALSKVHDPELHRDLVSLNMVQDIATEGDSVSLTVILTTPACPLRSEIESDVTTALEAIGAQSVTIGWGAKVPALRSPDGAKQVVGVKNILAVASNKGGVGKSTLAVNLAVALAHAGAQVGILDADITGPNIPIMFGLSAGFQADSEQGLHPVKRYDVKVISLGFLLPRDSPVVWRGPMIGNGVRQLLHDVDWGDLDYLIVDLPPGTSDASMSMAQEAPIAGVVIVTTPQPVALDDAAKCVTMFEKLQVPIFGIVENMSYFVTPDSGQRVEIFSHGGGRDAAEAAGLDFLGEVPLATEIREGGDAGTPIVVGDPDAPAARAFIEIAQRVAAKLSVTTLSQQ